jgi:autotransporter-associated beta strand protein
VIDFNIGGNLGSTIAVAINEAGLLDLNDYYETVGPITLSGGYIATGSGRLAINGDVTTLASTNTATINGSVIFGGGLRTITINDGPAPNAYDLVIPATIADSGAGFQIVNVGAGLAIVRLMGSNYFTGPLTISGGGIRVGAETPWALGATNGGTFLTNGSTLYVYNTGITNETITLAAGTTLMGEYGGQNPVWAGPILLTGDATIAGLNVYGLFDVLGAISGAGNLTAASDGELIRFSGSAANTYSGTTTVAMTPTSSGAGTTLLLNRTGFGNAIPGPLLINSNCVVQDLSDYQLYSATKPVTIQDTGLLDLSNHSEWIGPLTLQGAQVTTGTGGLLYIGGDITVNSSMVAVSQITGNAQLWNGTKTINCAGHNYSPDFRMLANLGGNGSSGIIKTGPGEASLAGTNNTYPGPTTVNSGSLSVAATNALGNTNTPVTVNNDGNLFLFGNVAIGLKPLNLAGPGEGQGPALSRIRHQSLGWNRHPRHQCPD